MSLPVPRRDWSITTLLGQRLAHVGKNQRDILVKVVTALLASGGWTMVSSCDSLTTSTTTNLWLTWASVVKTGGTVSWIVLRRPFDGVQLCIACSVDAAWCEIQWFISPAVGFTGGTTAGRPTASDEYLSTASLGADWLGTDVFAPTDPDPLWRAFVWVSADGASTRVAWMYQHATLGPQLNAWWQFDEIRFGPSGGWVPFVSYCWDGGNSYGSPAQRMRMTVFDANGNRSFRTPDGVNQANTGLAPEKWSSTYMVDQFPQDGSSLQYLWMISPALGNNAGAAAGKGIVGYVDDQWFVGSTGGGVTPVFADGDTGGAGAVLFLGSMMLPWTGETGAPGYLTPTDRVATSFYGRDCGECSCGPDDCDEPTTTLITMRNGAKALADMVDDDSVPDVTWNLWINQGVEDLWKKIVEATGDAFLATYDFALVGGAGGNFFDVTTIPARDFRRLRLLELNPDTSNRRRIRPFNLAEKDDGVAGSRWGNFDPQTWDRDRRYRRMGNKIYVERYELAAGAYRVYYEPKALTTPLAETCDALPDVLDEWAEYPQVFAAMKALGKEESDPGYLPTRLAEMRQDIAALKGEPDDDADASVIADVEDGGPDGGDWS